jgi:hypothetical protein
MCHPEGRGNLRCVRVWECRVAHVTSHSHYDSLSPLLWAVLQLSHPSSLLRGWTWFPTSRRARISCHLPGNDRRRKAVFSCLTLLQSDNKCSSHLGQICGPPRASVWRSNECDHCSRCSVPHLMAKSIGSVLGWVIFMLVSVHTWQVTWVSDCLNVLLRVRNSIIYDTPRVRSERECRTWTISE